MQQEIAKRCGYAFAGGLSGTIVGVLLVALLGEAIEFLAEEIGAAPFLLFPVIFGLVFAIWGFFDGENMIYRLERIWDFVKRMFHH